MPDTHYSVDPTEVVQYLDGAEFPARRGALITQARRHSPPPTVLRLIERIPDREYQSAAEVAEAVQSVE